MLALFFLISIQVSDYGTIWCPLIQDDPLLPEESDFSELLFVSEGFCIHSIALWNHDSTYLYSL